MLLTVMHLCCNISYSFFSSDTSNIIVKVLDLENLQSVKDFAADILATESKIDFLVLNAGAFFLFLFFVFVFLACQFNF